MTHPTHPAEVNTVRCMAPNCSEIKRESNHWFVCYVLLNEPTYSGTAFVCEELKPGVKLNERDRPVCGPAHAHKLLEKFLTVGEL